MSAESPMRIAIIGTRGIPANYGGFETFAEEISVRLVERGHHVVVYGRSNVIDYPHRTYRGVQLVVVPTISRKHFDTLVSTFLGIMHVLRNRVDVVLIPNSGNAIISWIPRVFGMPVLMNVDGLEWRRRKWGRAAKSFLKLSEWLATWMPNRIVTDARTIQEYYRDTYGKTSSMIPYGACTAGHDDSQGVDEFGLKSRDYFLYVSRLEPENNALMVIEAFVRANLDTTLVIVGDAPYASDYIAQLKAAANDRVQFLGFVFGEGYRTLQRNAYVYIHATEVGGTHPALVEAMGFGNCVLTYCTPENLEVVADAAICFSDANELAEKMREVVGSREIVQNCRAKALERVSAHYDWDRVTEQYETLLASMLR